MAHRYRFHPLAEKELNAVISGPKFQRPQCSQMLSITSTKISSGGFGKGKNVSAIDKYPPIYPHPGKKVIHAGQDLVGEVVVPEGTILFVLDGHGCGAEIFVTIANELILHGVKEKGIPGLVETVPKILDALVANDDAFITSYFEEIFSKANNHKDLASWSAGSTATYTLVLTHQETKRRFVVTANVGDSPAMLVDAHTGQVERLYGQHSWDRIEEVANYTRRCETLGLKPLNVIYGRFNCKGAKRIPRPDYPNLMVPFNVFKNGLKDRVEIDEDTKDKFLHIMKKKYNIVGGFQAATRCVPLFIWCR